jgi:hypothetical protein
MNIKVQAMMKRAEIKRKREPRFVSHFPSLSRYGDLDLTSHMFIEDIHLALMPIGGRTEKHPDFSVEVEGPDPEQEKTVALCRSLAQYDHYEVNDLICDTVQEVAMHLAWQGKAVYEIIPDRNEPRKYYLHSFTTKCLFRLPGCYIQIIPPKDYKLIKKRFIIVRSKDIWDISVPSILGGVWGYKRSLSRLRRYNHLGPSFWLSDIERQIQDKNFNFQDYVMYTEAYYTKVTKPWGWNRRDYSLRNNTEFYSFYKNISFKWAQAILREHIIKEINILMQRLEIESRIIITGLPLSQDILRVRQELLEGKISFAKAHDMVTI